MFFESYGQSVRKTTANNRVDAAVIHFLFFVVTTAVVCVRVCVRRNRRASSHPSNDSSTVVLTVRIPTSFLPVIVRQNLMIGPNAIAKMSMHHNTVLAVSWPEGQLGRCPVASRNRINLCNIQPCL